MDFFSLSTIIYDRFINIFSLYSIIYERFIILHLQKKGFIMRKVNISRPDKIITRVEVINMHGKQYGRKRKRRPESEEEKDDVTPGYIYLFLLLLSNLSKF